MPSKMFLLYTTQAKTKLGSCSTYPAGSSVFTTSFQSMLNRPFVQCSSAPSEICVDAFRELTDNGIICSGGSSKKDKSHGVIRRCYVGNMYETRQVHRAHKGFGILAFIVQYNVFQATDASQLAGSLVSEGGIKKDHNPQECRVAAFDLLFCLPHTIPTKTRLGSSCVFSPPHVDYPTLHSNSGSSHQRNFSHVEDIRSLADGEASDFGILLLNMEVFGVALDIINHFTTLVPRKTANRPAVVGECTSTSPHFCERSTPFHEDFKRSYILLWTHPGMLPLLLKMCYAAPPAAYNLPIAEFEIEDYHFDIPVDGLFFASTISEMHDFTRGWLGGPIFTEYSADVGHFNKRRKLAFDILYSESLRHYCKVWKLHLSINEGVSEKEGTEKFSFYQRSRNGEGNTKSDKEASLFQVLEFERRIQFLFDFLYSRFDGSTSPVVVHSRNGCVAPVADRCE